MQLYHDSAGRFPSDPNRMAADLPLVVSVNCLEDPSLEQEGLDGVAAVEHVGLSHLADGRIESAAAVLVHSLAFLPRAVQRRLRPWQLVLCLGSTDHAVDSALAADLGLRLVHVDAGRAEEVADTVMALFLGLLRRTHLLSRTLRLLLRLRLARLHPAPPSRDAPLSRPRARDRREVRFRLLSRHQEPSLQDERPLLRSPRGIAPIFLSKFS